MDAQIERVFVSTLEQRVAESHPLIQVVIGPRQVGKTTGIKQLLKKTTAPALYFSADQTLSTPPSWIIEKWQTARKLSSNTILVIDEIQKIQNWPEQIKALWDKNSKDNYVKLILLGSSSLQLQKGLTESLTGRFELIPIFHWSYHEFNEAFDCSLENYLMYGGYPGAYRFHKDSERWLTFMKNSIVETVIGQDILSIRSVSNPALFRQAFEILCSYPAQEISYTKLLGQLQNKGNTDLVKSYISMYENAFLLKTLSKYSVKPLKRKSSSPKLLPMCPALFTAQRGHTEPFSTETRGRLFELAVGADLIRNNIEIFYWRTGDYEVDYIATIGSKLFAIEVKSGAKKRLSGLKKFSAQFANSIPVIITPDNYQQFSLSPKKWLLEII